MVNWITAIPPRRAEGPVLVVDGGATHSRVGIVAPDGRLLAHATGAPTNARSVGSDAAAANLAATVAAAFDDGGDAVDPGSVVYGLVTSAAVDTTEQSENLSQAVRPAIPGADVFSVPDTMGCWAATNGLDPAVAVISGTGSVVVAADREQALWRRFGGWDFLLGDEGSGYALGRAALQETLLVHEGRSPADALAEAVLGSDAAAVKHVTDADDLPDAVHQPSIDKAWIASFAPLVLRLADAGDEPSLAIVRRESRILAAAAAAGLDVLAAGAPDAGPIPLGLFGGTFHVRAMREAFVSAVGELAHHEFHAAVPEHTALVGTFAMARGADPAVSRADIDAAADVLSADLAARRNDS